MLDRAEELEQRVRETPLLERLVEARSRIGKMCSEGRPPRMTIPVQHDDDDFYISTTLADAQATIADLQGQVEAAQKERDEQGQLKSRIYREKLLLENEYFKVLSRAVFAEKEIKDVEKQAEQQIATLQQRVAQLEGERDALKRDQFAAHACAKTFEQMSDEASLKRVLSALQADHARVLGLVQAATKLLTELTIIPIGCSREQELAWKKAVKDLRAASLPAQPAQGGAPV